MYLALLGARVSPNRRTRHTTHPSTRRADVCPHTRRFHGRFAADLARPSPKRPTRARGSSGAKRCSPPARCCAPGHRLCHLAGLCQDATRRMPQGGTPLMRSARRAHRSRHTPRSTCVVRHAPLSNLSPPVMRPAPRHRTACGNVASNSCQLERCDEASTTSKQWATSKQRRQ